MALELDFSKLSGTDILDMAIAIEDEAQMYYEQLADWVRKGTNGEASDFFNRMATREERHRQQRHHHQRHHPTQGTLKALQLAHVLNLS